MESRSSGCRYGRVGLRPGSGSVRTSSSTIATTAVVPILPKAEAVLAICPSLPGLLPAMLQSRLRKIPWVLWLQDMVTDGAVTTGELGRDHPALRAARRFERLTYSSAAHIVVISEAFRRNLLEAGVPEERISLIHNPMTRPAAVPTDLSSLAQGRPIVLAMGNIGRTQGLEAVVEKFQLDPDIERLGAQLVITGDGVATESVQSRIQTDRVVMRGVVTGSELDRIMGRSALALVSQRAELKEFNLPSKLMNYMAHGIPVIASVDTNSEAARIVRESGAGWVTDPENPSAVASKAAEVLKSPELLARHSKLGFDFAERHFSATGAANSINGVLKAAIRSEAAR